MYCLILLYLVYLQNAMLSHGSLHGQPAMNPLGILPYSHTIGRSGASAAVTLSSFNPLETQVRSLS